MVARTVISSNRDDVYTCLQGDALNVPGSSSYREAAAAPIIAPGHTRHTNIIRRGAADVQSRAAGAVSRTAGRCRYFDCRPCRIAASSRSIVAVVTTHQLTTEELDRCPTFRI